MDLCGIRLLTTFGLVHFPWLLPTKGILWFMSRSWHGSCAVNSHGQVTLRLGTGSRRNTYYTGRNGTLVTRWHNEHNLGTMWYNIATLFKKFGTRTVHNDLTICHSHNCGIPSATHNVLFNIPEQNRTQKLLHSKVSYYNVHFPQTL